MKNLTLLAALLAPLAACTQTSTAPAPGSHRPDAPGPELAVEWNRLVLSIAEAEDGFMTLKGVRATAMMHVAMHDALNAVEPRYATYALDATEPLADPIAAAARAAHAIVLDQYPDRRADLDAQLARWVGELEGASAERGEALGRAAAAAVLEARSGDGWDTEAEYTWHPMGPGVYAEFNEHSATPEGFVFGLGWTRARPFMLERSDQFRSPPPPEIASEEYTRAWREVRDVGSFESETRTPDQAHLAMWWKEFSESSHNRLARDLVAARGLDLWEATRMFALLDMSIYDAYVNVFDNKFFYNHWRPYTAIRWAAHDGNPGTDPVLDWTNMHEFTYPFPSYPSAHGCASAAAMEVLADSLGAGQSFTMRTTHVDRAGPFSGKLEMDPPYRSFDGFRAAALECALSRIYLGIHFRYDSVEGNRLGTEIGQYAVGHFLTADRD